jgi:hypothetical protein
MATVSCARLQEHKARDRCALCATRCAELDDLNLHVKSPLANDLASRFGGLEHFSQGYRAPALARLWRNVTGPRGLRWVSV